MTISESVGLLTLYSGLLLPWLGGVFWLIFVESRSNHDSQPNRVRQAGYGFFLGYAVLFWAVLACNKLIGTVSWPGLMVFLLIFSISGAIAFWMSRAAGTSHITPVDTPRTKPIKTLILVLMALTAIHLLFIAVETFTQPVYPWDAWLAWVYRAKAWYLAGGMAEVVSKTEWATATSANVYTIDAWGYPLFPSVIPYWAALSLGRWSETLINAPVLMAGLAIGMALYGQCREHGLGAVASLISAYLLFSIPLFGTHLALAGYADIWMAGFTGLGFIAVIRGAIDYQGTRKPNLQVVLGLLMILFGAWVKNEGAVWFLAALAMLILVTCKPRVPILMMLSAVIIALITFTLGYTHIDIPLIGKLGMVNDHLAIPFIGNFVLEIHNIWPVYWDNFITMGNWNLLWVLVFASLVLGFKSPNLVSGYHARRAALSFILIFLATQLFIFGFTNQGLWADTYTAINRLPLHFTPALLFAVVVIANASLPQTRRRGVSPRLPQTSGGHTPRLYSKLLLATSLAIITVATGTVAFLAKGLPDQAGETLQYPAADFTFAFGSGEKVEDHMRVDGFSNGYALLTSGPVNINADAQPVLQYTWLPPRVSQEAAFFWRRSGDTQNVLKTEIAVPGTYLIDLSTEPEWRGEITEIGFLLAGVNGETIEVGDVLLFPDSLSSRLKLMWGAWTSFETWSQQSINFLHGGDYRQVVALPLLVITWLLVTLMLLWLLSRGGTNINTRQILVFAAVIAFVAWLFLDIRWSANNLRHIKTSLQTQWQADEQQRSSNDLDGEIFNYVQRLKNEVLGDKPARILIAGDENAVDYYLLRAKYHLLPHSVDVAGRIAMNLPLSSLDFVIFFGQPEGIAEIPGWNPSWQKSLVQVDHDKWGIVYKIK